MNERIAEIARQSGATNEQGQRAETVFCFTKDELGEFAEFIVRECADIANKPGARIPGYYIKKHFGVEE